MLLARHLMLDWPRRHASKGFLSWQGRRMSWGTSFFLVSWGTLHLLTHDHSLTCWVAASSSSRSCKGCWGSSWLVPVPAAKHPWGSCPRLVAARSRWQRSWE
ncbi:TPA: hypothetical protein ACH3X3_011738 [Trebouxia sp. C0006]